MKKLDWTMFIFALILITLVLYSFRSVQKECEKKGGVSVGYYGYDCWDNVNKTFIK